MDFLLIFKLQKWSGAGMSASMVTESRWLSTSNYWGTVRRHHRTPVSPLSIIEDIACMLQISQQQARICWNRTTQSLVIGESSDGGHDQTDCRAGCISLAPINAASNLSLRVSFREGRALPPPVPLGKDIYTVRFKKKERYIRRIKYQPWPLLPEYQALTASRPSFSNQARLIMMNSSNTCSVCWSTAIRRFFPLHGQLQGP